MCTFNNCNSISLSEKKSRVHCQENHKSNYSYISSNISIQGLLSSRFFFKINSNDKDIIISQSINSNNNSLDEYNQEHENNIM